MTPVMTALVPGWSGRALPGFFPLHVRLGLLLSVVVAHLYALLTRWRPLGSLAPEDREAVLHDMAKHDRATLRALVQWWKLVALMTQEEPEWR